MTTQLHMEIWFKIFSLTALSQITSTAIEKNRKTIQFHLIRACADVSHL